MWRGLAAAERTGFTPIKINAVVIRGMNDDELCDLAGLTLEHDWQMRFIELMPVGNDGDWGDGFPATGDRHLSVQEMRDRRAALGLAFAERPIGNRLARTFRIPGAPDTVGFISPMGDHFCASCSRLRLIADSRLRPCLLTGDEVSVRKTLCTSAHLAPRIEQAVARKPRGHQLLAPSTIPDSCLMCRIGG